jgi:hypothetical protein
MLSVSEIQACLSFLCIFVNELIHNREVQSVCLSVHLHDSYLKLLKNFNKISYVCLQEKFHFSSYWTNIAPTLNEA